MSDYINKLSKQTQGFYSISKKLIKSGYSRGFSLAAVPYDFKESECDNKIFGDLFYNMVEMLYKNTNKKVVVIAYSYGNLNTNYQLNYHPQSKKLKSMVKHIINIGGPLAGASKTEIISLTGSNEFYSETLGGLLNVNIS